MKMYNQNDEQAALIELNKRLGAAEKARDETFMRDVLADSLMFRRANGSIVDKACFLDGLKDPANTYDRLDVDDIEVRTYQDLAVVTLCVDAAGMKGEKPFSGRFRNVRIFMKDSTATYGWRCHMWFNTKIGNSGT